MGEIGIPLRRKALATGIRFFRTALSRSFTFCIYCAFADALQTMEGKRASLLVIILCRGFVSSLRLFETDGIILAQLDDDVFSLVLT